MKQGEENNANNIQANIANSERDSNRPFDDADAEKWGRECSTMRRKS